MPIRFRSRALLATVMLTGLMGAGCFTDPINRPPVISALGPREEIFRGLPAYFTATVSDPDSDQGPITPTWAVMSGTCPGDTSPPKWPAQASLPPGAQDFMVPADITLGPFCVWVFATDRHGAVDVKTYQADPTNRAPTARIDVTQPDCVGTDPGAVGTCLYPRYSDFWLSGAGSSDADRDLLSDYQWTLDRAPTGSAAALAPCLTGGGAARCFSADLAGQYTVSLTVRDPLGASDTKTLSLFVAEDRTPCLAASVPAYTSTLLVKPFLDATAFRIDHVDDDGDPYPAGAHGLTHFRWYVGADDGPLVFQDNDFPSLDFPADRSLVGRTRRVRVEILDRDMHTQDILFGCGDKPICEARPGCFQRVTWTVEYRQ